MMVTNMMSVDLEDYFCDLPFSEWKNYENRVIKNTKLILDLFEKHNVTATFFTLGYIAEKHPELIEEIISKGHEISSHGYAHLDIRKVSRKEFEEDFKKSLDTLYSITKEKILGFRAPFFSIDNSNSWILNFLRKHIKYDSSIFPVKSPLYGVPNAPRVMYHPSQENFLKNDENEELIEIPPLTNRIFSLYNLPVAGGFYFRALPYFLISQGIRKFNDNDMPAMLYFHPKDLDKDMPKIKQYTWHYYYGKRNIVAKFEKLLNDFKFTSVRDFFGFKN